LTIASESGRTGTQIGVWSGLSSRHSETIGGDTACGAVVKVFVKISVLMVGNRY
jgi:hypothetical protein